MHKCTRSGEGRIRHPIAGNVFGTLFVSMLLPIVLIIPVVGLLDIPLAVPLLGWGPLTDIMIYGLAVGLFFTTPLFTLIFQRQLFEPAMPDSLKPTMFILIAPTAVGFSSYVATTGHDDLFTSSLFVVT